MKVVYEKSVLSQISEYKCKAKAENRTIAHIIVSDEEAILLYDCLDLWGSTWIEDEAKVKGIHNTYINRIKIKVKKLISI